MHRGLFVLPTKTAFILKANCFCVFFTDMRMRRRSDVALLVQTPRRKTSVFKAGNDNCCGKWHRRWWNSRYTSSWSSRCVALPPRRVMSLPSPTGRLRLRERKSWLWKKSKVLMSSAGRDCLHVDGQLSLCTHRRSYKYWKWAEQCTMLLSFCFAGIFLPLQSPRLHRLIFFCLIRTAFALIAYCCPLHERESISVDFSVIARDACNQRDSTMIGIPIARI